jgi:hypothetical protein
MIYFGLTICVPGKGSKVCSSHSQSSEFIPPATKSPEKEVFYKTLAFFCSSLESSCAFDPEMELGGLLGSGSEPQSDSEASNSQSQQATKDLKIQLAGGSSHSGLMNMGVLSFSKFAYFMLTPPE